MHSGPSSQTSIITSPRRSKRVTVELKNDGCWAVSDPDHLGYVNDRNQWSGLKSLAMVESERTENGKTATQTRYYISSLPNDARTLLSMCQNALGDRELRPLGVGRSFRRRR